MDGILSKADLSNAQKALYELAQAEQIAQAMQRCGLDAQEHLDRCQHYRGVMEGIRREFSAGPSAKGETSK